MANVNRKSALSYIPGLKNNAVLQLIIFCSGAYLALAISWSIVMIVYGGSPVPFQTNFLPNLSLTPLAVFKSHWWALLTYGWLQQPNSFWELLSNMLWLYCFGSVVQMLVGPKHVAPLYAYSIIVGGVFYVIAQLLPGRMGEVTASFLGGRAGLMGMAVAAVALTPNYKFYITETFTIPLMVVFLVFAGLMVIGSGFNLPTLLLVAAGGGMGYAYVKLLKNGYQPARWAFTLIEKTEGLVTPQEKPILKKLKSSAGGNIYSVYQPKHGISQRLIDEILDKINQKGYNSLSKEEKDVLLRAGRE